MPSKGRRYGKKKGMGRRRYQRRRVLRRVLRPVHHFKEMYRLEDIQVAGGLTTSGVLNTTINSLTNWSAFENLFDLYKITAVKFKFLYKYNAADPAIGGTGIPTLYTAINRDPMVGSPSGVGDILNDDGIRIHRCDGLVGKGGIYIKSPKPDMTLTVQSQTGGPVIGTAVQQWNFGVGNSKQPWLCTGGNAQALDQSGVKHFGLRYLLDNTNNVQSQVVEVYATLYFSMKEQD